MVRRWIIGIAAFASSMQPAGAQFIGDYGGGWGPSLDTSIAIGNDVLANELGVRAGGAEPLRSPRRAATPRPQRALFRTALARPATKAPATGTDSRFRRSAQVTREVQDGLLRDVAKRQPDAVEDYRKSFATSDWPRQFEAVTAPYRLSADDAVDTLTAYWVMAWIVANRAELPSPAAVNAARAQVARGYAASAVASYDDTRRQKVADEAIFNFMVLNAAWRNEADGANAGALATATRRAFLPLGADLQRLTLTAIGFTER